MKTFPLAAVLAFSIGMALAGCNKEQKKPDNTMPKEAAPQALSVKTATVEAKAVQRSVDTTGTLLPWDENIINSEVSGTVEKIIADLGDRVKAGQTLAILDQREARLNLDDAQAAYKTNLKSLEKEDARLTDAKATFNRYSELYKEGMVAASQYDNAKAQYEIAAAQLREAEARVEQSQAKVELARKRLSDTVIKSPAAGEIKKRFVSIGETVSVSTKLYSIVSVGTLKFRGTVSEASVPEIKAGQDVRITVDAYRDKVFTGKLTRMSPAVDNETRTLEIEASIPNAQGFLKPGFFATGQILTRKEANVPFVPEPAVYSFVGVTKVFVIDGETAHERHIKTGARSGDTVEVIDNIKPGETVATTNLPNLYEGAKVTISK